jgi:hypothetical protein
MENMKRIIRTNPYLGNPVDLDEDLFAKITECESIEELYNALKSWAGAFKYKNLLFINSYNYGVFVYDLEKSRSGRDYIEHLTMDYMDDNRFAKLVNKLLEK